MQPWSRYFPFWHKTEMETAQASGGAPERLPPRGSDASDLTPGPEFKAAAGAALSLGAGYLMSHFPGVLICKMGTVVVSTLGTLV